MNVLLISQCSESALQETRRVLDHFAERKGDRTWQTAITQQGLVTLQKMLRKKARRNTAVACHWLKSGHRTELLWIIGNIRRFNMDGAVPTHTTERNILRSHQENLWHTLEDIALLSAIAGLFHDFGKANLLFQNKLKGKSKSYEPYRHEWVSLRLFEALVKGQSDEEWLTKLAQIQEADEKLLLARLVKDRSDEKNSRNPFEALPPLARTIGWLIVSHHHLPCFQKKPDTFNAPGIEYADQWLTRDQWFDGSWNSPQAFRQDWEPQDWERVWKFPNGTPLRSKTWREKAHRLAERAFKRPDLMKRDWLLEDRFSSHLSRMVLMLADHTYSASPSQSCWQDSHYLVFANTKRDTGELNQKLDEHNIGVSRNALRLSKILPQLHRLPGISRHKDFKKRITQPAFRWQNKAYDLACSLRDRSLKQGFFGVNMASTGCGKTFANGRIMYGLADEKRGCRFSIALGLRTLTLQTGDALRDRLHLSEEDLAVLIGSEAVQELHRLHKDQEDETGYVKSGSESAEAFFAEHHYVVYDGALAEGSLGYWLQKSAKLNQLISAPILVSTVDHLIPATEGYRGGKQIAPMLRLLSADLVLDEPDDFDLADLPALSRLVNWAGMLGARVLLSSATLPPVLVEALFSAYVAGRKMYRNAVGEFNVPSTVYCAWFDEYDVQHEDHEQPENFMQAHRVFVDKRVQQLSQAKPLRKVGRLPVPLATLEKHTPDIIASIAATVSQSIVGLHDAHHQIHPKTRQKLSVGLVRMANINPLVAVAKKLLSIEPPSDYRVYYCIYHSRHPLIVRSGIEHHLDAVLTRHQPEKIWEVETIRQALTQNPEQHHIFVVLATSVAEVGRDHDYDWAIAEPSSMRSLIQLAGRVWRHRPQRATPTVANLLVWEKNYKALCRKKIAYEKPGFEADNFQLEAHDLNEILTADQLEWINAIPRIQERESSVFNPKKNLADLEHDHLRARLLGFNQDNIYSCYAARWWRHSIDWNAEMQQRTPFRKDTGEKSFFLYFEEDELESLYCFNHEGRKSPQIKWVTAIDDLELAPRVQIWAHSNFREAVIKYAEDRECTIEKACVRVGEIMLHDGPGWFYHPMLGFFKPHN